MDISKCHHRQGTLAEDPNYPSGQNFPLPHMFLEDSWQSWYHTRIPGTSLIDSWYHTRNPRRFLVLPTRIPGTFLVHFWANIQGFLIYSSYIPGTFLVAGCTIIFQLIRPSMPVYGVFPYALLISHRLKYSQIKNKYIY
jgi:hypothetical protein